MPYEVSESPMKWMGTAAGYRMVAAERGLSMAECRSRTLLRPCGTVKHIGNELPRLRDASSAVPNEMRESPSAASCSRNRRRCHRCRSGPDHLGRHGHGSIRSNPNKVSSEMLELAKAIRPLRYPPEPHRSKRARPQRTDRQGSPTRLLPHRSDTARRASSRWGFPPAGR